MISDEEWRGITVAIILFIAVVAVTFVVWAWPS